MTEKCFSEDQLQAFLDRELDSGQAALVTQHIAVCDPCAALLAEIEFENSLAFEALDDGLGVFVPTNRLWSKINEEIAATATPTLGMRFVTWLQGFGLTPVRAGVFAAATAIVAVGGLYVGSGFIKQDSTLIATQTQVEAPRTVETETVQSDTVAQPPRVAPTNELAGNDESTRRPVAAENAKFDGRRLSRTPVMTAGNRQKKTLSEIPANKGQRVNSAGNDAVIDGESGYVEAIARLEKSVERSKDMVLRPSARVAYEKDLALVNQTITKMRREVTEKPDSSSAREILFASYRNKLELLSSVNRQSELMAAVR